MTAETDETRPTEAQLRERAAAAGIPIAPERMADVLKGARRLEAAAQRVRDFLSDPTEPATRP